MQSSSPRLSAYAYYPSTLAGPLISGLAVYIILSHLLVPVRVTIPLAIIISVLIFGLTKYYATNNINNNGNKSRKVATTPIKGTTTSDSIVLSNLNDVELERHLQQWEMDQKGEINNINREGSIIKSNNSNNYALSLFANIFFVAGYAACLLIVAAYFFIFSPTNEIFVPWEQFTIVQIIELGASIALCFFLPGYALLSILFKDEQITLLLKVILAYFLSILVTGLTGYVAVSALGVGLSNIIGLFIVVYLSILIVLLIRRKSRSKYFFGNLSAKTHIFELVKCRVWNFLKRNSAELIVFAGLLSLVVLSTYSLFYGVIIGDQWYHHGRSLLLMSGEFRDVAIVGADERTFSPFPSALLASFFSLSGIPSVNAYASIGFLNIIPVFAFYYFFKHWVPIRMKKAALLACTLFMLSSGFGWVYVLGLTVNDPPESPQSVLPMLYQAGIKSMDIVLGTSFIGAEHPGFSTPLIFMALPTGFTLLGLLRDDIINKSRFKYLAILLSITFLGILSHDEFYLFIIIASVLPIFSFFIAETTYKKKKNLVVVYVALSSALLLTLVLATFSFAGVGYFTWNYILGMPVLVLCLIFVTIMCILYLAIRFFYQKKNRNVHPHISLILTRPWMKYLYDHKRLTLAPRLLLVFIIAWLYVATFIVWSQLPVDAVEIQSTNHTVPWYLYPMKLGVTGLLGLAFILSYLFRKFEKEIFVFGIIVVVAFVSGPYYYEHRFNKYIMAGLAGFASLFIYSVIIKYPQIRRISLSRILSTGLVLGIVIFSSALSVLMYWGYNASAHDSDPDLGFEGRDFPPASEFGLYHLLIDNKQDVLAFNVAAPAKEYDPSLPADLIGKVHAFSGVPQTKLAQSPLTLDAYTLEGFYDLLHQSDTRYIVLPKADFVNLINESGKDEEIIDKGRQQSGDEERNGGQGQLNVTIREEQRSATITDINRFAIENFKKAYEDSKYLVLAVPPFSSPQSQADIGLVHKKSELSASTLDSDNDAIFTLPYDRELFKGIDNPRIDKNEEKNVAILYGPKEDRTGMWTDLREQQQRRNANYFESTFRIVRQNDFGINYAGIIWNDTNTEYTLALVNDRLEVYEQPADARNSTNSNDGRLVYVRELNREDGTWYTIKIVYSERTVNIYVNNVLAIQIPKNHDPSASDFNQRLSNGSINAAAPNASSTNTIHKIGLYSVNNVAEFRPIKVGEAPESEADRNQKIYTQHYYPLSMLALSKLKYDTFLDGDMSVLSKKIVILNLDSLLSSLASGTNGTFTDNDYLKFVNRGGTLVIMNIDDTDFFGEPTLFGKLFDIRDEVKFDSISYEPQRNKQNTKEEKEEEGGREDQQRQEEKKQGPQYLNISGVAREIVIRNNSATSDVMIKSYYKNSDNQKVTPFAIEKKYGMGRLIFLNTGGYFDAVAGSPQQNFLTLSKILNFTGLDTAVDRNYADSGTENSISGVMPLARIDGDLQLNGKIKINSSSFSILPDNNAYSGDDSSYRDNKFYVQSVNKSVSDYKSISRNSNNSSSKYYDIEKENRRNNHTVIEDLRLSGQYEVIIYLNGSVVLPSSLDSSYNYFGTSIPPGSDIVLKLHNGSTAEFVATNNTGQRLFEFSNSGEIHLSNVSESESRDNISVLLKSPEIKVIDGKIKFENLYNIDPSYLAKLDLGGDFDPSGRAKFNSSSICTYVGIGVNCSPLEINGKMVAILNHVDNYHQGISYRQGNYANSLSYIKSLDIEQNETEEKTNKIDLKLKLPADISQLAKERGITIPWQKALFSDIGLAVSISMFVYGAVIVILIMKLWRPRAKKMAD